MAKPVLQVAIEEEGKFKLSTNEGSLEYVMDTWSSIRESLDDKHLNFFTSDDQSIPFNREICCELSPLLFSLIEGTFEGSCCRTNYETTIFLPDFSSKTVYDLESLMIKGTVGELSDHDAKELKSLHRFLRFKSVIVKEGSDDELTVEHQYRMECDPAAYNQTDTTEGHNGDGGDSGEKETSKDETAIKLETDQMENDEVNARNDERVEQMDGEDDRIERDDGDGGDDGGEDASKDDTAIKLETDQMENDGEDDRMDGEDDRIERDDVDGGDDGGEDASKDVTSRRLETDQIENEEVHARNDERFEEMTGENVSIQASSKEKDDNPDMSDGEPYSPRVHRASPLPHTFSCWSPMQQILSCNEAADGDNTKNSHDELDVLEDRSTTENKEKENASVMDEDLIEPREDNHEEGNRQTVNSSEITGNYKKLKMNCNVKIEKLKKIDSDDSVFYVEKEGPVKKSKRFVRSRVAVSYKGMASSDEEKPYQCSQCSKKFFKKCSLKIHVRNHTGDKPRQFKLSNLKEHEEIHSGEKPYQCSHCSKSFNRMGNLKSHERIHTGEKPYQCSHCSKSFAWKTNLKLHERLHTGEMPYQCLQCSKSFSAPSNMKVHEMIHTGENPYQCKQCSKRFYLLNDLKRHEMIHTGEKPYQCSHCSKSFSRKGNMKLHEMRHSGEKPYQCTQCPKRFRTASHLGWHNKNSH